MNRKGQYEKTGSKANEFKPEFDELPRVKTPLQESEKNYRDILDGIEVGYTELDLAGNIKFFNNTACKMSSRSRDELIGLNYKEYMDEEIAGKVYQAYHEVYTTGIHREGFIHEIKGKDGKRRIIESSISLIKDPEGRITGFRSVWRDITDRKRTEEELVNHRSRLEAIFRSVKDSIIAVDTEGRVTDANKASENICDLAVEKFIGMPFADCLKRCNKSCYNVLRETLDKKITVKEYQLECHREYRPQQVVVVTTSPLLDPQGKFMGAVLVIRDITRLIGLEKELRERHQFQNIVGKSRKMQDIYRLLEELADLETTVLITGESGTGKELVAKALHYSGRRASKLFVMVNCSVLAESLLESELFGHVKGAFTGAIRDRQGRFQAANGGTILLDEIGDISPLIQLKLLRVLQDKVFERVGESIPQKVDVRVIACTNKNLKEKVRRGEFREDLYYRLKVVEISLPPLRDRLEDLILLVDHFIHSFNGRFKKNIDIISSEVLSRFMDYPWLGNVRELEHVMEHAFVLCRGRVITLEHLPLEIRDYERSEKITIQKIQGREMYGANDLLDALNKTGWNKAKAARLLGINRRTIYRKINKYQVIKSL